MSLFIYMELNFTTDAQTCFCILSPTARGGMGPSVPGNRASGGNALPGWLVACPIGLLRVAIAESSISGTS